MHKSFSARTVMSKTPRARTRPRKSEPYVTGDGVWDSVKSGAKKVAKFAAPVALGLAAAAGAHYLTKRKHVPQDSSRYTDQTLPFANSDESSYRNRDANFSEKVPLTPAAIQALLAIKALHSAYQPSAHHPFTAGGSIGGSFIGAPTLAALAESSGKRKNGVLGSNDAKIQHLMGCKHCQGSGIGKKLWEGIKSAGKTVYETAKPYVLPAGAALATGALGYYALKNGGAERLENVAGNVAAAAKSAGKYASELIPRAVHPYRNYAEYNSSLGTHRPVQFDYDGKLLNQPVGHFGLGSLG